jgi:hypothetical protein
MDARNTDREANGDNNVGGGGGDGGNGGGGGGRNLPQVVVRPPREHPLGGARLRGGAEGGGSDSEGEDDVYAAGEGSDVNDDDGDMLGDAVSFTSRVRFVHRGASQR